MTMKLFDEKSSTGASTQNSKLYTNAFEYINLKHLICLDI